MAKNIGQHKYQDYVSGLRTVLSAKNPDNFPRLIAIVGSSQFLHHKACVAVKAAWLRLGLGDVHSLESCDLDQSQFHGLWSQVSLFEPRTLYILRRAGGVRSLANWFSSIPDSTAFKSHIVIDCDEKLAADLQKQMSRLSALVIHAVEPATSFEFIKVATSIAKRFGIELEDAAWDLLIEATGHDLSKIENEISNLSLIFSDQHRPLNRVDLAGALGSIREDDVFELFALLREKKTARTHLMTESFMNRGESAVAITGILARYAREQIERGAFKRGLSGLKACAKADRQLKSLPLDETLILAGVIDSMGMP